MAECECGTWVSPNFVRVFASDGEDTVERCIECVSRGNLGGKPS